MNNASEMLKAAKALIDTPEKWTKGSIARDADGWPTAANAPEAVCWCSIGAYYKVMPDEVADTDLDHEAFNLLSTVAITLNESCGGVADFNDSHTHEQVMKMWDNAIKSAEQAEAAAN